MLVAWTQAKPQAARLSWADSVEDEEEDDGKALVARFCLPFSWVLSPAWPYSFWRNEQLLADPPKLVQMLCASEPRLASVIAWLSEWHGKGCKIELCYKTQV